MTESSRLISGRIAKKTPRTGRRFQRPSARELGEGRTSSRCADVEIHTKTPDPSSYTAYADAGTCAATAAPTPVNELAAPQLQTIEKSVEFPATLFDVTHTAPPVNEHLASAPVNEYVASAAVNKYVASPRVIEYVAPAPVATLLEPPVPVVHIVQAPQVQVVQNTIETPQLQIIEKSFEFPATCSAQSAFYSVSLGTAPVSPNEACGDHRRGRVGATSPCRIWSSDVCVDTRDRCVSCGDGTCSTFSRRRACRSNTSNSLCGTFSCGRVCRPNTRSFLPRDQRLHTIARNQQRKGGQTRGGDLESSHEVIQVFSSLRTRLQVLTKSSGSRQAARQAQNELDLVVAQFTRRAAISS